jgi:hypothetical protein
MSIFTHHAESSATPMKGDYMNTENPATTTPSIEPRAFAQGSIVRILKDENEGRTFTISEITTVGNTGKQQRCTLVCTQDGSILSGIAPSRLATPYAVRTPKVYDLHGMEFTPVVLENKDYKGQHPAQLYAGELPALLGAELLDLVKEAAEKDTAKSHQDVVMFCVKQMVLMPTMKKSWVARISDLGRPVVAQDPNFMPITIAKIHSTFFRNCAGGK